MEDMQMVVMQLIVNSGEARSRAMEAIGQAKDENFPEAEKLLEEANAVLAKAHESQTEIIQEEAEGNIKNISILMAHAQDHLMNAITVIDMAREFVGLYKRLTERK